MGEKTNSYKIYKIFVEKYGGANFGNLNVETKIVLKRYSQKYGVEVKIRLVWFRIKFHGRIIVNMLTRFRVP
jgi:hypothetical protein